VPRSAIVLGKVLGGTALAVAQAGFVLLAAPLLGLHPGASGWLAAVAILFLLAFGLTSLSFCIAWSMRSTQGFHAIMTVFLMPLWLLSGAFFPAAGAPPWLRALMAIDPLTYGLAALRHALDQQAGTAGNGLPSPLVALAVTLLFALAVFIVAIVLARKPESGRGA
jgi:ABC-2 type transport system permease protein